MHRAVLCCRKEGRGFVTLPGASLGAGDNTGGNGVMTWGPTDYLSWGADIASIVSLVVSSLALWGIRSVRSRLVGRMMLGPLKQQVADNARKIAALLGQYDEVGSKHALSIELRECAAHLKFIKTKVKGSARMSTGSVLKHINRYRRLESFGHRGLGRVWHIPIVAEKLRGLGYQAPVIGKDGARLIYEEIHGLLNELDHFDEEQRIGNSDG